MRLCSYVVAHDKGFAPNPFGGFCTLAACTPNRQGVRLENEDWLLGTSPLDDGQRLVYAMQISEVLDFDDYYSDKRFQGKKPRVTGRWQDACGDNIYHRDANGEWTQDRNPYHGSNHMEKDTRNPRVYISDHFFYFGEAAPPIPADLGTLIRKRQGCHCFEDSGVAERFVEWLEGTYEPGIHGQPRHRDDFVQNGAYQSTIKKTEAPRPAGGSTSPSPRRRKGGCPPAKDC